MQNIQNAVLQPADIFSAPAARRQPSPQEFFMTTRELKKFVQENCDNPALGVASMDDFTPQEIKDMEQNILKLL